MGHLEELVEDLANVERVLKQRGWTDGYLLDLSEADDFDGEEFSEYVNHRAPVCMTGAVGAALDGASFIEWATENWEDCPEDWEWSPRANRVIKQLLKHRPYNPPCGYDKEASDVRNIVEINDGPLDADGAMKWVKTAREAAEARLAKKQAEAAETQRKVVRVTPAPVPVEEVVEA